MMPKYKLFYDWNSNPGKPRPLGTIEAESGDDATADGYDLAEQDLGVRVTAELVEAE